LFIGIDTCLFSCDFVVPTSEFHVSDGLNGFGLVHFLLFVSNDKGVLSLSLSGDGLKFLSLVE